ncbi:MAG: site-specific integrase [Chloroflexota bacterium]|nr:site-specific integrase [Chloroflexota bacterium]
MAASHEPQAVQLALFEAPALGRSKPRLATPPPVNRDSTLETARWWFKRHLESRGHPANTISAYTNDLTILQARLGTKPLHAITSDDIRGYLDAARRASTRKRRLTSVREFFTYVTQECRALTQDPTEPFFPERIYLKTPVPLFPADRKALLDAAAEDGLRSLLAVYLMLELGLNRTELIAFRRQHIDISDPEHPVVYVQYDNPRWRHKERRLLGDRRLADALRDYEPSLPDDRLFPMLPQAVNALVNRLVRVAELKRSVTPQTLRDTFAVEQARAGKSEDELLAILGLADDPRNRDSVRRYLKLAEPPQEVLHAQ